MEINGVEVDGSSWVFDSSTNEVTVTAEFSVGDTIMIFYTHYPKYSSNEIQAAIKSALTHISINNYADWDVYDDGGVYPDPSLREQNLIAIVASLVLDPDNKSYRLPDISINVPQDDPLPTKISKIIGRFKKNSVGEFDIITKYPTYTDSSDYIGERAL